MADSSRRQDFVPDLLAGLATGLFNVPSGLAYDQPAGVKPIAKFAAIITLLAATVIVDVFQIPTELVSGPLSHTVCGRILPQAEATVRVLDAENKAWEVAQKRLAGTQRMS